MGVPLRKTGNLLALCVSGGLNFFMNERVIFRKKKALPPPREENS